MLGLNKNIISQYLASLEMLKQAIEKCPASIWNSPQDKMKFWHIAYHALFYTHFYLQETAQSFTTWSKHHPEYESFGQDPLKPLVPYLREEILEYLVFCQEQVRERVPQLNWKLIQASTGCPSTSWSCRFTTSATCSSTRES